MRIDTFRCDVCGQLKGEKNHWFRIETAGTGLELHPWGTIEASNTTLDLCSDQCVIKTVQKYLTEQAQVPQARLSEVRVGGEVLFPRRAA